MPAIFIGRYAAGCGMTLEQIRDELLKRRDLSKKGSRQLDTCELPA